MTPKRDEWREKLRSEITYNDETCEITFSGTVISTWNDEANCSYPEDLTWSRTIGSLVTDSFTSGARLAREQTIKEVCEWLKANFHPATQARFYASEIEERFKE